MHVRAELSHVTGWCLSELLYWETTKGETHCIWVSEQRCVGAGSFV